MFVHLPNSLASYSDDREVELNVLKMRNSGAGAKVRIRKCRYEAECKRSLIQTTAENFGLIGECSITAFLVVIGYNLIKIIEKE